MNHLFVDNLTVIDFSYFHNQRGILGESWIVDIELGGELDDQGMVFDFGHVKKRIKQKIDEKVDHRFLISDQTRDLTVKKQKGCVNLSWCSNSGHYEHSSPEDAILLVDAKTINKSTLSRYLEQEIKPILPDNVSSISITLREEVIDSAYYHYSHGLRKHEGNCQRIVHGHRSRIEIYENHQRSTRLEELWAAHFRNIYIATREDLSQEPTIDGKPHMVFAYTASQGEFRLLLPAKKVYLFDTDTTVELIAAHIAERCSTQHPANHYRVKAYEGVGKGAIAIRQQRAG